MGHVFIECFVALNEGFSVCSMVVVSTRVKQKAYQLTITNKKRWDHSLVGPTPGQQATKYSPDAIQ